MSGRRTPSQDYEVRRMSMPKIRQAQGEYMGTVCNPNTRQLEHYYRLASGHVVFTCFPATAEQVPEGVCTHTCALCFSKSVADSHSQL